MGKASLREERVQLNIHGKSIPEMAKNLPESNDRSHGKEN